ncbi:hypothetical protein CsatA_026320 [Cannabis sativa]
MDSLFLAKMPYLSSGVYPPKLIIQGCNNHFPFVPKNFKPQLELETMDSKVEELPTNPNQGNPVARYGRSSQVILEGMDINLVSDLRGPPQADKECRKKVDVVSIRESSQPKTQTCTKRPLRQSLPSIEEFLESGNRISAARNGIF